MALADRIIGVESGGNATARNPNSTATGAGQFIESTWLDTIGRARPDLVQGKSREEILALRNDPTISREMTDAYAAQNGAILSKNGFEANPGNTYLAHFAGPQGAVAVLSADPSAPVSSILTPGAMKANPFLANMTAGDLQAWAARKMGGSQPAPTVAPAPQSAPVTQPAPAQSPLNVPSQPAPIFAGQPAQSAPQPAAFEVPQQPAMAPIFAPPRKPIDLSRLQAALAASRPIFGQG